MEAGSAIDQHHVDRHRRHHDAGAQRTAWTTQLGDYRLFQLSIMWHGAIPESEEKGERVVTC